MARVGSDIPDSTHDMSLSDGLQTWSFNIRGDPPELEEQPISPTSHIFGSAGKEFGSWEPGFSHIGQSTWIGGRGQNELKRDESKFFDSKELWTFTPEHMHPAPQWRFSEKLDVASENYMPGAQRNAVGNNVRWQPLLNQVWYSRQFTALANITVTHGQLWLRKIGTPTGNITMALYNNSSGVPGTLRDADTLAATDFSDELATLAEFDDLDSALTASTVYHVVVYSSANDDDLNHWEVGYGTGGDADLYDTSTNQGAAWSAETTVQLLFRLTAARWVGKWFLFDMEGALYALSSRDDGTTSVLYINGDRGIPTSVSQTVLTSSGKSWTTDQWAGAWVRITKGPGKGEYREIASNTGTALTVSPAFSATLTTASEYVIYATDYWTAVVPATDNIDAKATDVVVFNNQALIAYGSGSASNMLRVRWTSATPEHSGNDEAVKADLLTVDYDRVDGAGVWRVDNTLVILDFAPLTAWATDLTFGEDIAAGDTTWLVTNVIPFGGAVYVVKENELGMLRTNRYTPTNLGLSAMADRINGLASAVWNLQLYFNWAFSLEQLLGTNLDDVGPWLNAGLPDDRRGHISALEPVTTLLFGAVDAGTARTSSVLAWNKIGWGEVFRAWATGRRIQSLKWQTCPGTQDRLWVSVEGELCVMDYPDESLNMLNDDDMSYQHEAVFVSSTVDMDAAALRKLFDSLSLTSRNLGSQISVRGQYQVDDDIGGTNWSDFGEFTSSDYEELGIWEGGRRRLRIRLILRTGTASTPPVILSWVVKAFARTPVKYQWSCRIETKGLTVNDRLIDDDPDAFLTWLKYSGEQASSIVMRSRYRQLDDRRVVVEPPSVMRLALNRITRKQSLALSLAIRES